MNIPTSKLKQAKTYPQPLRAWIGKTPIVLLAP